MKSDAAMKNYQLIKPRGLFFPDDSFYLRKAQGNHRLQAQAKELCGHLGMRSNQPICAYSEEIHGPCLRKIAFDKTYILVNARYRDDPFRSAAILARQITDYQIRGRTQKPSQVPSWEHGKFLDRATINAGLGLVVLNGTGRPGWRSFFKKAFSNNPAIAYYKPASYYEILLEEYPRDTGSIVVHLVPWLPIHRVKAKFKTATALAKTTRFHRRSQIFGSVYAALILVIFAGAGFFVTSGTSQKNSRQELFSDISVTKASLDSCLEQVNSARQNSNAGDDFFVLRNLESKEQDCRSLQNRYKSLLREASGLPR